MLAFAYGLALVALTGFGLHLLVLAVAASGRERLADGAVPHHRSPADEDAPLPAVTVQIPLFNEKYVAGRVIDACARLSYPGELLEIQVLDDSTDETSRIVARRCAYWQERGVDVKHIRRGSRSGFKAGALEHGLATAGGEYIAVFDADFCPSPDFLRDLLPSFRDDSVGMVQARWGHLNERQSRLTRAQAVGLDSHFMVEQRGRCEMGWFFNFNGTAGIWRKACIEDAGGWSSDTLTEDLDLSYRAQMRGWRFVLRDDADVPAELPDDMNALRGQQFRWTKGAVETARKNLAPLWRSPVPRSARAAGAIHLLCNVSYVFMLLAALLHAPLIAGALSWQNGGRLYLALLSIGLLGLAGLTLCHVIAARRLYPEWPRRMAQLPWYVAGTIGLSLNNSIAVFQAMFGVRTSFVRTPKVAHGDRAIARAYAAHRPLVAPAIEIVIGIYCLGGALYLAAAGAYAALPFQLTFAAGFLMVGAASLNPARNKRPGGNLALPGYRNPTIELKYVP